MKFLEAVFDSIRCDQPRMSTRGLWIRSDVRSRWMASGEPGSELAGADEANNVMLLFAAAASIHAKARGEATTRREGGSLLFFSFFSFGDNNDGERM